jgi:threonine dehydrogenase-like Zn-dependent dehydrogenase
MKAIKVIDKKPVLVDVPEPKGDGVKVKVVSSSICGSDIHMMALDILEGHIIGHEFAGVTPDGRGVAIEPLGGCGQCGFCNEGHLFHCESGYSMMGVLGDGGMAEYVTVPAASLIELPTGLDISTASLVEPLAVAVHGLERARVREGDRILIIGAGPIGLAIGAVLRSRGMPYDIVARYNHQKVAAERLGAGLNASGHYDVVMDAVGSSTSLRDSAQFIKPLGRIGLVGAFWDAVGLEQEFCVKEAELIPSIGYNCKSPNRSFDEAGTILHRHSDISQALVTHRFPLDGVSEAFTAAADRSAGAIKVVFDVA